MLQNLPENDDIYDFIAVGAGPANLSLAIQSTEAEEGRANRWLILEKESEVRWHAGMLLPGSRLDTHFVKDLITLTNPTSSFTFLNYLCEQNRIEDFLNCGNTSPFRADFDRYIQWVSSRLGDRISNSSEVVSVDIDENGDYLVHSASAAGEVKIYRTRNVVVGVGFKPRAICGLDLDHPRVIHSSDFLGKISRTKDFDVPSNVLVVGGGQSAAELLNHLHMSTPHSITGIVSDFGLMAKEGTAFINESYNGRFVDRFHDMTAAMRQWFVAQRRNMNYGVVDSALIDELYNNCYYSANFEDRAIEFLQFSKVVEATTADDGVNVRIENRETGEAYDRQFDYVVLACGYDATYPFRFLHSINTQQDASSLPRPVVNRDYSVDQGDDSQAIGKVYLNGGVSYSHGPAGDVLSVIAYRARDILTSIEATCAVKVAWPAEASSIRAVPH
jgi:L-ornithine N5-monooxygenase